MPLHVVEINIGTHEDTVHNFGMDFDKLVKWLDKKGVLKEFAEKLKTNNGDAITLYGDDVLYVIYED